jgi:hypothetical protein
MVSPSFSKVVAVKGESHEINVFSSLANSDSLQKVKVKQIGICWLASGARGEPEGM